MKLFFIFIVFIMLIFLGGMITLIVFIVRKSTKKRTGTELSSEKQQMLQKVIGKRAHLTSWNNESIDQISNTMQYNFMKGFSRTFNGTILSSDRRPVISYRMVDRGWGMDCRIAASTTNHLYFIEGKDGVLRFEHNNKLIGRIDDQHNILDEEGNRWGHVDPEPESDSFAVYRDDEKLADILKTRKGEPSYLIRSMKSITTPCPLNLNLPGTLMWNITIK